ncbi:MAG: 50S ribosomal protein 3 [Deltaproteobacteria bacterium]|nr:50S ribosomal protein 3 [Deltaproteobacteria bacterium]
MTGLIGKKIGMTQFYNAEGNVVPVTVVQTEEGERQGRLQRAPGRLRQQKEPARQ